MCVIRVSHCGLVISEFHSILGDARSHPFIFHPCGCRIARLPAHLPSGMTTSIFLRTAENILSFAANFLPSANLSLPTPPNFHACANIPVAHSRDNKQSQQVSTPIAGSSIGLLRLFYKSRKTKLPVAINHLPNALNFLQRANIVLPACRNLLALARPLLPGSYHLISYCRNLTARAREFIALASGFIKSAAELLPTVHNRVELANYILAHSKRLIAHASDLLASAGAFLTTSIPSRQLERSRWQMSEAASMCRQHSGKWKMVPGKYPGIRQPASFILACANKYLESANRGLESNKMILATIRTIRITLN